MYVLSNIYYNHGAAVIAYPGLLTRVEQLLGSFFLIPSSIHEVILVPVEDMDAYDIAGANEIVRSVNEHEVAENEILSDHVYNHAPYSTL